MSLGAVLAGGGGIMFKFEGTVHAVGLRNITVVSKENARDVVKLPYGAFLGDKQGLLKKVFSNTIKVGDQVTGFKSVRMGKLDAYSGFLVHKPKQV